MSLPVARLLASAGETGGIAEFGSKRNQNLNRDFRRHARRCCPDMPDTYLVDIPLMNDNGQVEAWPHPVNLPHEFFSWLAFNHRERFLERVCGGSWDTVNAYWDNHASDEWCHASPARELRETGVRVAPCTLYGDDAEPHRGSAAMVVTWSSPLCFLSTWLSRVLITVLPLRHVVPESLEVLYEVIRWSFDVLLSGHHPARGHDGKRLNRARRKRAGTPLSPDGSRMAVTQILGDWKWIKESLGLCRHYGAHRVCHCCGAVAAGPGPPYTDLTEEAVWRHTIFDYLAYMIANCLAYVPQLCRLPGFHPGIVLPDIMHTIHIGVLGLVVSSLMLSLAMAGAFGHARGKFRDRLAAQLRQVAYPMFREWCRARQIRHSQVRFGPGLIGCSASNVYPEWHGKAHNCMVVAQWLGCVVHLVSGPWELEEVFMRGLNVVLDLLHRKPRTVLTPDERQEF